MTTLIFDLRHAARVLLKHAPVNLLVVFTLALAIGATTAIFSVVYGVLLRPLPYPDADRLVAIWEVNHRGAYSRLADPNFDDFRTRSRSFAAMAKYQEGIAAVVGPGEPTREMVAAVSKDFFAVLGVQPSFGRGLTPDDARIGAAPVAIVSHRYWTQRLGATRDLAAARLRIEDRVFTVVGVMPAGFQFPPDADVWAPIELEPASTSRTSHNTRAIGRLRGAVTAAAATADLGAVAKDIIARSSEQGPYLLAGAAAVPLRTSMTGRAGPTLYVLLAAVFFLLLVACANVVNLLLAQASARQRELAIRHALGAGRARILRQFVVETTMLLAASCLGSLMIASLGVDAILALAPPDLPRLDEISLSWPVLVFAMGLSAAVAIALGLVAAARASRRDARATLADGARGQTGGPAAQRLGRVLVAAQMAIAVVLVVGAVLLGRSLLQVLSVDPGFRTDGLLAIDVSMPYADDPAAKARLPRLFADLFERLRGVPGVEDAAAVNAVPLDGGLPDGLFAELSGQAPPSKLEDLRALFDQKDRTGTADYCAASPAYFRALGIPLIRGRLFDERDHADAPHVAVISESLARSRWHGLDPIGRTIEFGNMDGDLRPITIVGVVGDTREDGLDQPPRPTLYVNFLQRPRFRSTVVLRSSADLAATIAGARMVMRQMIPDVPPRFRSFDEIYAVSLGARKLNLIAVGAFAATALVLAMAGIYGVMAYSVSQRRREIGVRIALGATPRQVFRMILRQGLSTAVAGVGAGVAAAAGLARGLQTMLFGVTTGDPLSFASSGALLLGVAAIACLVPARRATRSDPVDALRQG